jgi:hypothetical protein
MKRIFDPVIPEKSPPCLSLRAFGPRNFMKIFQT